MKKHFKYLNYVIKHKWFVLMASIKIRSSIYRAIVHDLSKFLPSEWFPYVEYFYGREHKSYNDFSSAIKYEFDCWKISKEGIEESFSYAWLYHQHRNKHHWQYWLLKEDSGKLILLEMPKKYVLEMIADWMGAGRAIKGKWEVKEWFYSNKGNILLHPNTKEYVESIINQKG